MDNTNFNIARLIAGYLKSELTVEEEEQVKKWLTQSEDNRLLLAQFKKTDQVKKELTFVDNLNATEAWKKVAAKKEKKTRNINWMKWMGYAASIVAVISLAWLYLVNSPDKNIVADKQYGYKNDVLPGSERATLSLSDGRKINLDEKMNDLQESDGTTILGKKGELVYEALTEQNASPMLMNTLTVPKAGTYRLTLSDGTKVWVNALSELRFPLHFGRNERRVYVKGEAYFEVAKDSKRPFRVEVNKTIVEALGTAFNIRAYTRNTTATLIEGLVKVSQETKEVMLNPGTAAEVKGKNIQIKKADLEKVIAWKAGEFYFHKEDIYQIMEEVGRWYDLDIQYVGSIPRKQISGSISRTASLAEICRMLTKVSTLTFQIDQKKMYVTSNENLGTKNKDI